MCGALYSQTREVPITLILGRNREDLLLVFSGVPNYTLFHSPGGLVLEASGSLNLPAPLTYDISCGYGNFGTYIPSEASVCTGPSGLTIPYSISGPSSITAGNGSVLTSEFTSASGITTFLYVVDNVFAIASSYVSGQPIVSRSTAPGKTLADLGLTSASGTLGTWTLATTGDTINVRVLNTVPGPLPVLGAGAAFAFSRRLRQRIQRSKAPANA